MTKKRLLTRTKSLLIGYSIFKLGTVLEIQMTLNFVQLKIVHMLDFLTRLSCHNAQNNFSVQSALHLGMTAHRPNH